MYRSDLKNWPIFTFLDPAFLSKIHMTIVYGTLGGEALIVTKDNMVYAIGSNDHGCLGTGDTLSYIEPRKVEALCDKEIRTIAYGRGPHVLALTGAGEVYSWGHNNYSELGNCTAVVEDSVPKQIKMDLSNKFVVDIACGSYHSLALTREGEVYAWGGNNFGQVNSNVGVNLNTPKKVNSALTLKIVSISCGQAMNMVITNDGEVYGWGQNNFGQLGIGNYVNQGSPCKVTSLIGVTIEKIACGCTHVLALSNKGNLYVWGANNSGQLGLDTGSKSDAWRPVQLVVEEVNRVADIATMHFSHISVALVEGNRIYVWGSCLSQSVLVPTLTTLNYLHDAFALYATPKVTYKPIVFYDDEEEVSFEDCFREAFDDSTTSDFVVNVQQKSIFVHKAILRIRSEYFRTMFQNKWADDDQCAMDQYQFSYNVYKAFLKYLYTDEIDLPEENVFELLELANSFNENQLKKRCTRIMKKAITIENSASIYSMAVEYDAKELEEYCFKFMLNHITAVMQSENFAKLSENMMKTFKLKAAHTGALKT
ncbi:RCC1 and BTB domain-containing protein 1 [Ceratina calcarata]|uniref:RCC1 and BTB domain-containing protein 1 n=1 Tax=Ceratina calcarata TaxID=156304 RepID=A0AAJ7S824_9HYME|nr:RCC1 and BTB domain-containing protein 1 [Ceratina calcarata]